MTTSVAPLPELLQPAHAVVMKVGFHGTEEWGDILARKLREERMAGFCLWGYGGATCHPTRQVQPFARSKNVTFVAIPTSSRFTDAGARVHQMSSDGTDWRDLGEDQVVRSSRYALCLANLRMTDQAIPLAEYVVGIGAKRGVRASDYMRYRCDKACVSRALRSGDELRTVSLLADLTFPYAVFLR